MATIEQNLQRIISIKNDVIIALKRKGVTVPNNAGFGNLAQLISQIQVQGVCAIIQSLNHVSSTTNLYSVTEGDSFTTTLTADENYVDLQVTVEMGGTDITSTAYSNGTVTIGSVTGDVVITASATIRKYSIVYNLTNVTSENNQLEIPVGSEFITVLTADNGYTSMHIIVQQGDRVIHEGDHGATEYVTIQSVTGDLIITATAISSGS